MSNYILKYKGRYRILSEICTDTMDYPRETDGSYCDNDLYISCSYGNKIFTYGHKGNAKEVWLIAYIPSIGRGRNIRKALDSQGVEYTDYCESDIEVWFHFKSKDIDILAELLKARIVGANISPFSPKNLPKSIVQIPTEEIKRYKEITAEVKKEDLLIIHKFTQDFLLTVIEKRSKKSDPSFSVKADMKKKFMSRQVKEYIWKSGYWNEYLSFIQKDITKFYSTNK